MTKEQYKALRNKAGGEGLLTGGLWLLSFGCFIAQFRFPPLSLLAMVGVVVSAVLVVLRLRRYTSRFIDGIGFWKAFGYSVSVYFYASLILAFGQWIYFQYIDHGFLLEQYSQQLTNPLFLQLMESVEGFKVEDIEEALKQLSELRPIDISLNFLSTNILLSFVLALPTAAIASMLKPRVNGNNF